MYEVLKIMTQEAVGIRVVAGTLAHLGTLALHGILIHHGVQDHQDTTIQTIII